MRQRSLVLVALLLAAVGPVRAQPPTASSESSAARTFVFVHGAWGGGWAWRQVDSLLTSAGQRVYRPTLTGLGERVHLASADIGLETHVDDVVNVLTYEQLNDVILVGHSYGGMVITGVADRVPERVARLVYIDAFVPDDGESVADLFGARGEQILAWVRDGLIVPPWISPERPPPYDVPHPARTFTDPVRWRNPAAREVPATYVLTVAAGATEDDDFLPFAERAAARGWEVQRLEADHNPQWSAPAELVRRLLAVPEPARVR